jgi:D-methionine transport system substrate-binding protein
LIDTGNEQCYFQHTPYLEQTVEDTGYDLTHIGGIHIGPMGIYSQNIKDINDIPKDTEIMCWCRHSG